jgi:hypothetical protein
VNEDTPYNFHYFSRHLVSHGRPSDVTVTIYCDRSDRSAVVYRDGKVEELTRLKVKIGDLPKDAFDIECGKDDKMYYVIRYSVEVTYQSASTKYELVHKGE